MILSGQQEPIRTGVGGVASVHTVETVPERDITKLVERWLAKQGR